MFLINLAYKWGSFEDADPHGAILLCSGLSIEDIRHRDLSDRGVDFKLIDPQLYLSGLTPGASRIRCSRLVTYPWFCDDPPCYDTDTMNRRVWPDLGPDELANKWQELPTDATAIARRAQACIDYQLEQAVSALILPAPLCTDPTAGFAAQLDWLRSGASAAAGAQVPVLATVALAESCLAERDPMDNDLLETIADNITAMPGIDGAYLVIDRTGSQHWRIRSLNTSVSLLLLVAEIGASEGAQVVVNFADSLGFACLGLGATAFASDYAVTARTLDRNSMVDDGYGVALPRVYGHGTVADYYPQRDLFNRVRPRRLLHLFESERTPFSDDLFDALDAGRSPELLPQWAETANNTAQARLHYVRRIAAATAGLPDDADQRREQVFRWLQDAERDAGYIATRCREDALEADSEHVPVWRQAYESVMER